MTIDVVQQVEQMDVRLRDVEENVYGEQRSGRQGLINQVNKLAVQVEKLGDVVDEVEKLTTQVDRLVMVIWGLVWVSILSLVTIGMVALI
jgi:SMC interacting uncharacterized protein involved in chromosome segregation